MTTRKLPAAKVELTPAPKPRLITPLSRSAAIRQTLVDNRRGRQN